MKGKQISPNFSEDEFRCKGKDCCGGICLIDYELVFDLQKLRDFITQKTGKEHSIIVTSGYRCSKHNKEVGGRVNSAHIQGSAIDFYIEGLTLAQTWLFIEKVGTTNFTGMGSYPEDRPQVIHIDNSPDRFQRWVKRGAEYHYLF
jgi:uncharacterized protein YcbK (DUF882 family)